MEKDYRQLIYSLNCSHSGERLSVIEEKTSSQVIDCGVCQLEEHFPPRLAFLRALLTVSLVGRERHAQDNSLKLTLSQRRLLTLLKSSCQELHGSQSFGNAIVDLRQEVSSLPHRCQLFVLQEDVVIPVYCDATEQNLCRTENRVFVRKTAYLLQLCTDLHI